MSCLVQLLNECSWFQDFEQIEGLEINDIGKLGNLPKEVMVLHANNTVSTESSNVLLILQGNVNWSL